jgi:luciferase family oxidoreductase group 1
MTAISVLDLVPIRQGGTAGDALRESLELAREAERNGYVRYWVAEHHNMPGIASAATPVVVGMLAAGTTTIRVGAGGVMLPNHSPLVVAEQFGTLASLYPDRIDLGLGRAPGTDAHTSRALRRDPSRADAFAEEVRELQSYLAPSDPNRIVRAVPGVGTQVPLWILGSSLFGADLAGRLGLPYAFASHFAPAALGDAVAHYRRTFRPSAQLRAPYVMLGINAFAAATEAEARRQYSSIQQTFANLLRGRPSALPPPADDIDAHWSGAERQQAMHMLRHTILGTRQTVGRDLVEFAARYGADELIVVSTAYDHAARLASCAIVAEAFADAQPEGIEI